MKKNQNLIILGFFFIFTSFCCNCVRANDRGPNILLLTIDACRPDHLGCYGYKRNTTPNIDKLANEGALFINAFSQSAWTTPGMISIFTSLYPFKHNVDARGKTLSPSIVTLPEVLRENGYSTQVFPRFIDIPNYWNLGFEAINKDEYTENRNDELIELIEKQKARTFFIWYHYNGVHLPYNPLESYADKFLTDSDKKMISESKGIQLVKNKVVIKHGSVDFREEDKRPVRALYDGQLSQLDDYVGRLIEKMKGWKILDSTIIIITADHGEELLEHGFIGHASTSLNAQLYEEIIRIPLIIRYPKKIHARIISHISQQVDIMPTILDLISLPVPSGLQGNSLLPLLNGSYIEISKDVYCETNKGGYQSTKEMQECKIRCIRTKRWKLICTSSDDMDSYELYDLENDPKEKSNIIKERPKIAETLKIKLKHQLAQKRNESKLASEKKD